MPPPVRSRSPTSPTLVPSRRAACSSRRASRSADDAHAGCAAGPHEPVLEAWVVERLHRRDGATDPAREEQGRQLDRAEVEPDEDRRPSGPERLVHDVRGLDLDQRIEVAGAQGRCPRDLEVVARGVPVRQPDEALEGARVGRGAAHER